MKKLLLLTILLCVSVASAKEPTRREVANHLQNISVTIKAEGRYSKSEGSGVLLVRKIGGKEVTFVWTAAHVVDNLRSVREVVDEKGATRKLVEFKDPKIVKELVEDGRRVGEIKMDAKVIKYSDADHGHDLALLMVRAKDYGKEGTDFYLDSKEPIIPIGTQLFHVGSLLGQMGANSMTSGIISQVGRIHGKVEFDQTTVTAFPGSSGGGVYLQDGRYVGMLVRGAGENFNLMVPVRRMKKWAADNSILWAIDKTVKAPNMEEIEDLPVEGKKELEKKSKKGKSLEFEGEYPFLIKVTQKEL
tara:strand:+ start:1192 stop:2100 length:909 start_codon:yes stop_codon:yes gene_type:complete